MILFLTFRVSLRPNKHIFLVEHWASENFGSQLGNPNYDWVYTTSPQVNANNRSIVQNRYVVTIVEVWSCLLWTTFSGKVLGGSSAINFEIFNRPAAAEYSAWSALNLGLGGWSWDGLLPFFIKSETYSPPLPGSLFPNPIPFRRRQEDPDADNVTSIPTTFLDFADSALDLTALDVTSLLDAAGAADTFGSPANVTTKRSLSERGHDSPRDLPIHGTSGPVKPSYNTWYSDIASSFINTVMNAGIPLNQSPVRPFSLQARTCTNLLFARTLETTLGFITLSAQLTQPLKLDHMLPQLTMPPTPARPTSSC